MTVQNEIHIAYNHKDAGHCTKTGAKLDMLGQIFGYENFNAIGVLRAIPIKGEAELAFLELNDENTDLREITDESHKKELEFIWMDAQMGAILNTIITNGGIDGFIKRAGEAKRHGKGES